MAQSESITDSTPARSDVTTKEQTDVVESAAKTKDEESTHSTPIDDHLSTIPDGGLRAWMSVLGGWLVLFSTLGYAQSFGVYQDFYVKAGTSTPSNISWIGSFQLFMMFFMSLPAGKLYDSGYFHHLQFAGIFLLVFCLFMLSLVDTTKFYQIFLSQGVGVGLGIGLLFLPAVSVQTQHFNKKRALAMGIVITGSSFGGIVLPIMHNELFSGKAGFPWGVRATAFMMLGLLIIAKMLMTTRLPAKHNAPKPNIGEVFKHVPFMLAVWGNFLVLMGLYFPYFYMQLFVDLKGLPTKLAFYTLAILNAGSVFGRTIPNYLADKYGRFNAFVPISLMCSVLVFVIFGLTNIAGVIVFSILYGFASGGFVSLGAPLLATLVPDIRQLGIYMGVAYFITSFAILTGNPICGALLGSHFKWWRPIVFSGVVMFAGSVLIVWARHIQTKRLGTQRV